MSLHANSVTYRYPGTRPAVLVDVSLTVPPGHITALVGRSGCGKSTLIRLLTGLLTPADGAVECDGEPVVAGRRLARHSALLTQHPFAAANPHLRLADLIELPARLAGKPVDTVAAAREVGLTPDLLARRPYEVSGGQLQRALLARALAQQPRYLLADEPTAQLDPVTTATIADVLSRRAADGLGVLVVTHDRALAYRWAHTVVDWDLGLP